MESVINFFFLPSILIVFREFWTDIIFPLNFSVNTGPHLYVFHAKFLMKETRDVK